MDTSRRRFLSLAAGAAAWSWGGGSLFAVQGGAPALRIGAVSDIHISFKGKKENCFQYGAHGTFRAALEYFRDQKVDVVTVTGDLADAGRLAELEAAGMQVGYPDTQPFIDQAQGVYEDFYAQYDWAKDLVERINALK